MNRFAPLTSEELSAATVALMPAPDDGELASPVPADAPPSPRRHPSFGAPTMVWLYRDASGALLCEVHRYDPVGDRKQFLPATCWRGAGGELEWRWKSIPSPRPLYGLDKLAENPSAPVIVTEGEKAADAASRIFRKSVCVTSLGGSQSAGKTDWKPLAGRKVLIWPDADKVGADYANAVAETLAGLDCEVSIIDAPALASISPDGGSREPMQGFDAADAIDEWADAAALARAAHGLARPFKPAPAYVSYGAFTMSSDGLTMEATKGRGESAETFEEWICGPFEILGATRDPHGRAWGKWLRFLDGDKREHLRHVSDAALHGDPAALCGALADEGLRINRGQQRALVTYLSGASVKGRVTMVSRTGWHAIAGRDVFVLPRETIGPRGGEHVILDAAALGPYEARGTLQDWRNGVGALASGHALPVLAISAALAGPLLHLAGQEGGGLNFFGPSSKGKTTLLQLGASAWGPGASPGYMRAWRATANGLEGAAASATDTCLVLDELGQVEARDAASALYSLSNGTGKARAARDGALREPKSWRALILSSGEIPTETKLREDKSRRARAGQLVRMLDIPADRGAGFGAFDHAGPQGDPARLAATFKHAAISHYGTAGPEFVRRLIANGIDGETIRPMISDFVASTLPAMADGQIDRAAARLGLIAAAGELATAMGVTPWREGEARTAAAWALERWIDGRGGTEPAEIQQAIEQVRLAIEQHGEARFEAVDDSDDRPVANRLGWRKGSGADREWWIPPQVWKAEICSGLDATLVAKTLCERGLLRTQGGRGLQCKVNLGGNQRAWAYVLTASIVDGGADAL
jgi:putative DNA primase/helicase